MTEENTMVGLDINVLLTRSILLIDEKQLRCAALQHLLEDWSKAVKVVVFSSGSSADLDGYLRTDCKMVILNLGASIVSSPPAQTAIHRIRCAAPDAKLVIISDDDDAAEMVCAIKAGVSGFIPTATDPKIALQALDFILSGGSFFPSAALAQLTKPQVATKSSAQPRNAEYLTSNRSDQLTARQKDVLVFLREGKSNKLIARELNMQEATVKVHVRQIMRKLGATNRTQAALRAIEISNIEMDAKEGLSSDVAAFIAHSETARSSTSLL